MRLLLLLNEYLRKAHICARAKDLKFFDDLSSMWAQKNLIHNNNNRSLYVCISFCIVPKDVTRDLKELLSLGLTHVRLILQICASTKMLLNVYRLFKDYSYIHMFKNERSFLKRSSTASYVVISYFNKMRLLSMKKNLKDPMNENEDAVQKRV